MRPRFVQFILLIFLGFFFVFLIPELGPAIRELTSRPSFVAAPRTPSPQTQAAPQAAAVPKLNLRDPRARNETKAKITSNVNRIKQLSREFKAVWDRKPPKIEGDVVDVGAFEKDLPPGKVKEYKAKATEAKTFLASLALQSYEPQGLGLFKELYQTSDPEFGAAVLSAVQMIDWDASQEHNYELLKSWLRELADSRGPNQKEALHRLLALHPLDDVTLGYAARNWAVLTEYEKLTALQGVIAFRGAGLAFLKDKSISEQNEAVRRKAIQQLERHNYDWNGKEFTANIRSFYDANPAVKRIAAEYRIPATPARVPLRGARSSSARFLAAAARAISGKTAESPVADEAIPSPFIFTSSPTPSPLNQSKSQPSSSPGAGAGTCEANHSSEIIQWGSSNSSDYVTIDNLSAWAPIPWSPRALSVDDVTGPGGAHMVIVGDRTVYSYGDERYAPTVRLNVSLVDTSQYLGTAGNAPALNPERLSDGGLAIPSAAVAACLGSVKPLNPARWTPTNPFPWSVHPAYWRRNREPVERKCGNGRKDKGEECGEPGLQCPPPPPGLRVECRKCRCIRSIGPPFGGPSRSEVSLGEGGEGGGVAAGGGAAEFEEWLARPLPRSLLTQGPEELVWEGNWEGSLPQGAEPIGGETFACRIALKSLDGAMHTKVRMQLLEPAVPGQTYKDLPVPADADGDLVPDPVELTEQLFNPATGRLEPTDICTANTRGVTGGDAKLDTDIDWHWLNRLTNGEQGPAWAQSGQEKHGDGITRWEEGKGFVLPESPIIETPDGRAARLALRVSEMRTEDGYGSGEGNNYAIPAVKQLFISDRTHDGAIQSLRGANRVPGAVAMTRFTGIQPVNVGYDYDAWARLQTVLLPFTATTSVRLGDLMGAVNPHNAKDGGVPFQKAQAGVLFREPVFSEERDILRSALAATLVRDGRGAVNNYRHPDPETPEGTVLGLPILFSSQKVAGSFNNLRFTGFPLNLELYFHMIGIHELNHKAVEGSHPSFTPPLEAVIPFADVPNLLSNGSIRNDVWYIIERRTTAGAFEYFAGMDLKTEVSGAIHPYYEPVPIRVFAIESLAVTIREGNNRITLSEWPSALFVRPADQGRRDSRIVAFALFKFFTSSRAQSLNELIGIIFSVKKFTSGMEIPPPEPVGRGGYAVDQDRSMLNQLSIEERPLDYRMMDPASEYRRP